MIRSEILKEIAPILRDQLILCNTGLPCQERHAIMDQPSTFYMLGTMGLASSIGLALAQPKTVISIDGDGSVLTNLGTLPTIANNMPPNHILIVIDNGSCGSTGDQPTYKGGKTDLAGMARAAGCDTVIEVQDVDTGKALQAAINAQVGTVMIVNCDSGNARMPVITMDPAVIRDSFVLAVAS